MRGAIARVERVMCCIVGIGLLVSLARRARPSESLQMYADRAGLDCDPEHHRKIQDVVARR